MIGRLILVVMLFLLWLGVSIWLDVKLERAFTHGTVLCGTEEYPVNLRDLPSQCWQEGVIVIRSQ